MDKSRQLQRKLYLAAKQSRERRFHALYDRIYRPDVLWRAWQEVRKNRGSCGIDGVSIEDVEEFGIDAFLEGIAEDLKGHRYRPRPVKRVRIPKPDGSERPLGIPTVRDRVVQQACKIIMEPVFEASFEDSSFGFRPHRNARQAVQRVKESLVRSWYVVDADIKGYFDTIDHDILLSLVKRRVSDKRVVKLIRLWLQSGTVEDGRYAPSECGTPQGGVISPLLANIYLHVLDRYWKLECEGLGRLVRYADDFIVLCRYKEHAEEALKRIKILLNRLRLTLHTGKSRIVKMETDGFDFLGFYFRKCTSRRSGKLIPFTWPSSRAMKHLRRRIKAMTRAQWLLLPLKDIIRRVNDCIRGWRNYFAFGNGSRQFQAMDDYVMKRLWRFFRRRCGNRAGAGVWDRFRIWYRQCGVERLHMRGMFCHSL